MASNKNKNWKFPKLVFTLFLAVFLCLYLQFAYLSLSPTIYGINMDNFASKRSTFENNLVATRGTIYDSENNLLALNVSSYTVIAYLDSNRSKNSNIPLHVVDKELTAKALSKVLNMEEKYILSLLERDSKQVELGPGGRGITELKKEEIENLNLSGIDFIEAQKRYYPNGDFASYILGYAKTVGIDLNNDKKDDIEQIVGELGIESKYDDLLKGKDGYIKYQKDRFGYKIPDTKEERINQIDGSNIYLTIDSNIQRFSETAIKEQAKIYNPEWMFVTVMNAKTGAILASASSPSFDPNVRNITNYENPLSSYLYEPGSTMKTFTYMCALEKGNYNGNLTYKSGSFIVDKDGNMVNDWNPAGWGNLTYDLGYAYSSNTAVANILKTFINRDDLKECFTKYGFGKLTGIELSRELEGSIEFNYPLEVATAGFGQGITTTPIQHLQALTMIANKGVMLKPHIISKIINPNNAKITYETSREELGNVVSEKTALKMKELMDNSVNASWAPTSATLFKVDGIDLIGKSGTAQIFNNKTGKYDNGDFDYVYSFSGMFPKDDPEIIIYAAIKKPAFGATIGLSKATVSVMENIAKYLQITDNNGSSLEEYHISSYMNKKISVLDDLKDKFDIVIIGNGDKIIKQYPSSGSKLVKGDKLFILTNDLVIKMPNLLNYSKSEVTNLLSLLNINYRFEGYGYAINQSIKEGVVVDDNVLVTFKNKEYIEKIKDEENGEDL
ncbi:MAG: penicillin-binding protein [Bacilli bacterium]